eukprot:gene19824-20311_t
MLSVVIPTQNSEEGLARTLSSLVSAAAEGIVREVIVADSQSSDGTAVVADAAGCVYLNFPGQSWGGRVTGAVAAMRRAPWLLLLTPHVVLEGDWYREMAAFIERTERAGRSETRAASFRLEYDDFGFRARCAEQAIAMCSGLFGLPVPQQGLVISRRLWDRVRRDRPVDTHSSIVNRIGRRQIHQLRAHAVVIAAGMETNYGVPTAPALAVHALAALGLPVPALGDWLT